MGGKPLSKCKIYVNFPIPSWAAKSGWTKEKITGWVKNAGGTLQGQFEEEITTHLIVDERIWSNKTHVIQRAAAANEDGRKVFVVSPDWLENCLSEQKKLRENTYLWEKLDQTAQSSKRKKKIVEPTVEDEDEDEDGKRMSVAAMMAEVFNQSTEKHISDHDRRVLNDQLAGEEKVRQELKEAEAKKQAVEREELEKKRREHAALMRRTSKKGRGDEFKENNHIYKDSTGFEYDITVTKVDILVNSNERQSITVQIYESDTLPHSYVTNLHFAGTSKRSSNNIIATIGANLATAMRKFRLSFRELTGVDWDDRIKAHNERARARQQRADSPGILNGREREDEDKIPIAERKFQYAPPLYGPTGLLSEGKDKVPEFVMRRRQGNASKERNEQVEQWMMSGANGSGPGSEEPPQMPSTIDLTEDEPSAPPADQEIMTGGKASAPAEATNLDDNQAAAANAMEFGGTAQVDAGGFVSSVSNWLRQDQSFNAGNVSEQPQQFSFDQNGDLDFSNLPGQQQEFEFDQTAHYDPNTNLNEEQCNMYASQAGPSGLNETQVAAGVGNDMLKLFDAKEGPKTDAEMANHDPMVSMGGHWPESMLAGFGTADSALGKRKREEDDSGEVDLGVKEFAGEMSATGGGFDNAGSVPAKRKHEEGDSEKLDLGAEVFVGESAAVGGD